MDIELSQITEGFDPKLLWATKPRLFINWVRLVGHEYDIDVGKFILGKVLGTIIGDDASCFGRVEDYHDEFLEVYIMGKRNLIKRVEWESEVTELPKGIRERLNQFLPRLEDSDWSKEESHFSIREEWREKILYFTETLINENPEYRDAELYALQIIPKLIGDWEDIELQLKGLDV